MSTYKIKRKVSATESEEVQIPATSVTGLATVATSGSYNDLGDKPTIPSVPTNYVTTDTEQDITGIKTFYYQTKFSNGIRLGDDNELLGAGDVSNVTNIMPQKDGTLAVLGDIPEVVQATGTSTTSVMSQKATTDELAKKANLDGGNNFRGYNTFVIGNDNFFDVYFANDDGANDHQLLGVDKDGIDIDADGFGTVPLKIVGNAGTSGQVLTSQGTGKTPIWADVSGGGDNSKHGYTELTSENLNTITEVGWYRAASGNSCTNRPSAITSTIPFVLEVEKSTDAYIKQTLYQTGNSTDTYYVTYVRYSSNSGSSWASWVNQQTMSDSFAQTFIGRKTFSSGISLGSSLYTSSSHGSSSQFLMSQGSSSAPKWVNLQVKVNGTTYTADSSGLIDLGTISGGTSAVSAYNDIY